MVWNGANDPQEYITDEEQDGEPDDVDCNGECRPDRWLFDAACPYHGARALRRAFMASVTETEATDQIDDE